MKRWLLGVFFTSCFLASSVQASGFDCVLSKAGGLTKTEALEIAKSIEGLNCKVSQDERFSTLMIDIYRQSRFVLSNDLRNCSLFRKTSTVRLIEAETGFIVNSGTASKLGYTECGPSARNQRSALKFKQKIFNAELATLRDLVKDVIELKKHEDMIVD